MTKVKNIVEKAYKLPDGKDAKYRVIYFELSNGKEKNYVVSSAVIKNALRQLGANTKDYRKLIDKEVDSYQTDYDVANRTGGKHCILITLK